MKRNRRQRQKKMSEPNKNKYDRQKSMLSIEKPIFLVFDIQFRKLIIVKLKPTYDNSKITFTHKF
jgi:hypothetical protein